MPPPRRSARASRSAEQRKVDRAPRTFALLSLLLLAACATPPELGRRHEPSGVALPLPGDDFGTYVAEARGRIDGALQVAGPPPSPELIEDRGPFELAPDEERCARGADGRWPQAALLIHPVGGTPYVMRDLGARLADACLLVRAILLPGHGAVPGDLLGVEAAAWLDAVDRGVAGFAGAADKVHLVAFSTGTTLALHHARFAPPPAEVTPGALVLISPVMEPPALPGGRPTGLLRAGPRWDRVDDDLDPVAYGSLPHDAVREVGRLAREVAAGGAPVARPVFAAVSATDAEIDAADVGRWFCERLSGPRWLLRYAPDPAPLADCDFAETRSSAETPGILDYAHTALPVSPADPRYGRDAATPDCRHYARVEDSPVWFLCVDVSLTPDNSEVRYGEITAANLERAIVRRLTFNPDFEAMADDVVAFLRASGLPWPSPPNPRAPE